MKIFKLEKREVLDKIYCDVCGVCCTDDNFGTETASLTAEWGYRSKKDGKIYQIDICENCFDATIIFFKNRKKDLCSE